MSEYSSTHHFFGWWRNEGHESRAKELRYVKKNKAVYKNLRLKYVKKIRRQQLLSNQKYRNAH